MRWLLRALLCTPLHAGDPVLLQTRRGALVQDRLPGLTTAARSLPSGSPDISRP
ncbi:hypothetical protein ACIOG7_36825 [Streptomyces sp. NPDC087894]|uniref:hypothetical protein n=1 Tax=Streptomyces sp. NPDC087894 TaxID=3365816 RepID=UPI0037FB2D26